MSKFNVGDKVVRIGLNVANLVNGGIYTVSKSSAVGGWIELEECIIKNPYAPDNFELYVETDKSPVENTVAVVEWLDKLVYVLETDTTVGSQLDINLLGQAVLDTDHGDIIGNQNVAEFINNRYAQLTEQANKAKREQLLKDIVSAKEVYEAKVMELELLEGK